MCCQSSHNSPNWSLCSDSRYENRLTGTLLKDTILKKNQINDYRLSIWLGVIIMLIKIKIQVKHIVVANTLLCSIIIFNGFCLHLLLKHFCKSWKKLENFYKFRCFSMSDEAWSNELVNLIENNKKEVILE